MSGVALRQKLEVASFKIKWIKWQVRNETADCFNGYYD